MYGLKQLLVLALAGSAAAGCICQSQKGPRSGTDKQATKKACLENSGSWDERPNYYTASYHYRAGEIRFRLQSIAGHILQHTRLGFELPK
ncbi:hypothetical protein E2P81_ATG06248 [Venturia nashicola]|nr:hypothetical protein E2P81_ATG06248 [Venturia nashicola]